MQTHPLAPLILLALPALAWADDAGVALHLQPAIDAPVVATVPREASSYLPSRPVEDAALAQQGWMEVDYGGGVSGFVELGELRGDTIAQGAPIHLKPDHRSQVITTFEAGDRAEIDHRGPWTPVHVDKELTLYMQSGPAHAVVTTVFDVEPIPGGETIPAPDAPASQAEQLDEGPTSSAVLEAVVRESDEEVAREAEAPKPKIPGQGVPIDDPRPLESPNFFEGRLERTWRFLFWKAPYPFQLVDRDGDRLWYLDSSDMLSFGPLEAFLGENVIVHGTLDKASSRGGLVIRAQHLR